MIWEDEQGDWFNRLFSEVLLDLTDFGHCGLVLPNFGLYSEANQLTHGQKKTLDWITLAH